MKPFRIDHVEPLESRSLLSATPAGLVESIVVRPKVAPSGTSIVLTFTEKNTSRHDIAVGVGPQIDGFVAKQGARVVWRSNAGIQPAFVVNEVLKPGQSLTLKATWDGRSNQDSPSSGESGPSLTGKFTVTNELATGRASATVTLTPRRKA